MYPDDNIYGVSQKIYQLPDQWATIRAVAAEHSFLKVKRLIEIGEFKLHYDENNEFDSDDEDSHSSMTKDMQRQSTKKNLDESDKKVFYSTSSMLFLILAI
jgi:hypothetical protein